jgi:hypothetical protein
MGSPVFLQSLWRDRGQFPGFGPSRAGSKEPPLTKGRNFCSKRPALLAIA